MARSRVLIFAAASMAVLYVGGFIALGTPPGAGASGGEIARWFAAHSTNARIYAWTAAFFSLAIAVFAGLVSAILPKPHRYVFLIGAAGFAIESAIQAWLWAGLALHPGALDSPSAGLAYDVALFWGPLLNGATTTMAGAVTVLGLGSRPAIPRWLTLTGAIFFIEQAVETITVFGTHGFIEPGGAMNLVLGGGLGIVWGTALVIWAVPRVDASSLQEALPRGR